MSEEEKLNAIKEIKEDSKVLEFVANVMQEKEDLQQEIERLNKELDKTRLSELDKEYKLNKVREYIEKNQEEHKYTDRGGFTYTEGHFLRDSDTLLEILDKGE